MQGIVLLQQRIQAEDPAERWAANEQREPIVVG
jgi:hypothetical protein